MTKRQQLAAALTAAGCVQSPILHSKYWTLQTPSGGTFFLGSQGALRFEERGRVTYSRSINSERLLALLAEGKKPHYFRPPSPEPTAEELAKPSQLSGQEGAVRPKADGPFVIWFCDEDLAKSCSEAMFKSKGFYDTDDAGNNVAPSVRRCDPSTGGYEIFWKKEPGRFAKNLIEAFASGFAHGVARSHEVAVGALRGISPEDDARAERCEQVALDPSVSELVSSSYIEEGTLACVTLNGVQTVGFVKQSEPLGGRHHIVLVDAGGKENEFFLDPSDKVEVQRQDPRDEPLLSEEEKEALLVDAAERRAYDAKP